MANHQDFSNLHSFRFLLAFPTLSKKWDGKGACNGLKTRRIRIRPHEIKEWHAFNPDLIQTALFAFAFEPVGKDLISYFGEILTSRQSAQNL